MASLPEHLGRIVRRAAHRGANRAAHVVAEIGYRLPTATPRRYGVEVSLDVPYRSTRHPAHLLDVYRPTGVPAGDGLPIVLYVHGGGFAMLSKDTHRIMALAFASRGYLVVNVNYRLGPRHVFPAPLEDVGHALAWVLANAPRYGGDTSRLVLAGESAGANLVTALAVVAARLERPEPFARDIFSMGAAPRAVLPIYGLLDVTDIDRFGRKHRLAPYIAGQVLNAAESYVGAPCRGRALAAPLASPLRIIETLDGQAARALPPFFVACGTKDPLLDDSRRLALALGSRGVPCEFVIHPGEIHGYNVMLWRPAARDMWRRAFRFLRRHVPAPGATLSPTADSG